jgi:hypothetical protein
MRVQALGIFFAATLCIACGSHHPQSGLEPVTDSKVVSVVVFNQRGSRVPFALLVGDSIVLDTVASLPTFHPPIVMSTGLPVKRGNYRVLVLDRVRGTVYEAKLQLRSQEATIEVWFNRDTSKVHVAYGKQIYI